MSTIVFNIASIDIPFRTRFEHASKARAVAENVLIVARDGDGRVGLGEGCPRHYVTGETVATARAAIAEFVAAGLGDVAGLDDLREFIRGSQKKIDANPSAFAALELAVLDLLARRRGCSIEVLLGIAAAADAVHTSAVYGLGGTGKFLGQFALFQAAGMRDSKVKLSGHVASDAWRTRLLSRCGRVRADGNNCWRSKEEAIAGLGPLSQTIWAIEEPVMARDWNGLQAVGTVTRVAIILDESAVVMDDLQALEPGPEYILNARVSKHGGILRTLAIIEQARAMGIRVIVGAQVGETSILARAAITAARAAGTSLAGFEAAYGTRLLSRDLAVPSIGFVAGGAVRFDDRVAPGLGLAASDELLAHVMPVVPRQTYSAE